MDVDISLIGQSGVPNELGLLQSQITSPAMRERWREPRTSTIRLKTRWIGDFGRRAMASLSSIAEFRSSSPESRNNSHWIVGA
jgi:hypothetical protein